MLKNVFLSSKSGIVPRFIFAGEMDAVHETLQQQK